MYFWKLGIFFGVCHISKLMLLEWMKCLNSIRFTEYSKACCSTLFSGVFAVFTYLLHLVRCQSKLDAIFVIIRWMNEKMSMSTKSLDLITENVWRFIQKLNRYIPIHSGNNGHNNNSIKFYENATFSYDGLSFGMCLFLCLCLCYVWVCLQRWVSQRWSFDRRYY